jgi:hypothetical protein
LQFLDVLTEAHIEHLVTLVEDLVLALRQIKSIIVAQIN